MILPTNAEERKAIPIYSGCIKYFPDALAAVAALSYRGNEQHNPGTPLHWDRSKSGDELDAMMRHVLEGDWDAVAWRALANLQKEIENGRATECTSERGPARDTRYPEQCYIELEDTRAGYRATADHASGEVRGAVRGGKYPSSGDSQ